MTTRSFPFAPPIQGTFFRAVDPAFREFALQGSRSAGRYSRPQEPTLYLSASRAGVDAAMIAHRDARSPELEKLELEVHAANIVDLRDDAALPSLGVSRDEAIAPWQEAVASGGTPSSWRVRDRLVEAGANGLIDPSRKRPGLWHLVLFRWNTEDDAPTVRILGT